MQIRLSHASLALGAALVLAVAREVVSVAPPSASRGLALMRHVGDSLPQHVGNGLRCTSCHLDDGLRASAMPWAGVTARFPTFRSRRGAVETIEQRVNDCIARSLAGHPLPEADPAMRDMVAYLASLRHRPKPTSVDTVRIAGDAVRGAAGYERSCARCHGLDGSGTAIAPAAYGSGSYSIGAGLARQKVLATFLRWNMPHDMPGTLTAQDAADIAAWMLRQSRQDHPGKERDWPRGDAPVDVAYATDGATRRGRPDPALRPVLPRRVPPTTLPSR